MSDIKLPENLCRFRRLVNEYYISDSIPIRRLPIREETYIALAFGGFTETGNFIESDDNHLKQLLTRRQYKDLKGCMTRLKKEYVKKALDYNSQYKGNPIS